MPAKGFFADLVVELFTTGFGEFFRVVEAEDRAVWIKNHRRRDDCATQRATPYFVNTSHQLVGFWQPG